MIGRRVRVRFAPVPSDRLDLGGARTALFNWLYARKTGGTLILRVEDTARASHQALVDALEWLGIDWDEGPGRGGAHGPYQRSARQVVYHTEAERLLSAGHAYRCFCTPEEIDELHRDARAAGRPPLYDGRCRRLPDDEVAHRVAHGVRHAIRFRAPADAAVPRGRERAGAGAVDDVVLIGAERRPSRVFADVVDDATMEITHVIRGAEDAGDTAARSSLCRALGYRLPALFHLPEIRGGPTSVQELRRLGYTPDGVVNALALLGWSGGNGREVYTRAELVESFSFDGIPAAPSAFDADRLRRVNAAHFNRLDPIKRLSAVYARLVEEEVLPPDFHAEEWPAADAQAGGVGINGGSDGRFREELPRLGFILNVMGDRLDGVRGVGERLRFFFKDDYRRDPAAIAAGVARHPARLERVADVLAAVEPFSRAPLEAAVAALAADLGVAPVDLERACRLAITGTDDGPDIFAVIQLVGRAKCIERVRAAARAATV